VLGRDARTEGDKSGYFLWMPSRRGTAVGKKVRTYLWESESGSPNDLL